MAGLNTTTITDKDNDGIDIDAGGAITIDSAGVSIDSAGVAANFTVASDGAAEDLTISVTGATDSSVVISSSGTGADAVKVSTSAGSIDIDSADNIAIDAVDEISIATTSADGHMTLTSAHTSGLAFHIDANANAGSEVQIDAGILDIDVTGAATLDSGGAMTLTGAGVNIAGGSSEVDITTTGTLDINANAMDMDLTDSSSITITSSEAAEDLIIEQVGGNDSSIIIQAAGTGTDAIRLNASGGSIDIDAADNIAINAVDEISIATTSADGHMTLTSAHTAGVAFHIDANAHADSEVQIDAGILDIDVTGAATLDAVGIALGAGSGELDLTTTGTMDINSAALDIDTSGAITIDAAGAASHIAIVTAHTAGDAFHLDANANVGSIVNIDAGILDIDSDGATTIDAASTVTVTGATGATFGDDTEAIAYDGSGNLDLDAVALDVDTSGAININAAGTASDIAIITAHTAGVAFHLDADANAGSIVDIDAGILDIDAQGDVTIDADAVKIGNEAAGAGILHIMEDTDNGANYSGFTVGNMAANVVYTLPTNDGSSGQQLTTDGSAVLSWTDAGSGGGSLSGLGSTDNALVRTNGTGGETVQGSGIIIDDSNNVSSMGTLASGAITSSGRIVSDDATEATSTTDGSLQTDGGLSVAKDIVIGDGKTIGTATTNAALTIAANGLLTAAAGITSTAASNTLGATSFNDADITNVGDIALDSISSDGSLVTVNAPMEIAQGSSGGATALVLDNDDTNQIALDIEAANIDADVLKIQATALTTADAISIDVNSLTTGNALFIDHDSALTTDGASIVGLHYDFDHGNNTLGDGESMTMTGFDIDMNDAANAHHANATATMIGLDIDMASTSAQGTITNKGISVNVSGGDAQGGNIAIEVAAGAVHMKDGQQIVFGDAFDAQIKWDHGGKEALLIDGGIHATSTDGNNNPILEIENASDGASTCLLIDNDDVDQLCIDIDAENTTADIINIQANALTTANAIDIPNADALTTGSILNLVSNASSDDNRTLAKIEASHANSDNVIPLQVKNACTHADGNIVAQFNGPVDAIAVKTKQVILNSPSGASFVESSGFFPAGITVLGLTAKVTTVIPNSKFIEEIGHVSGGSPDPNSFGTFANASVLGNLNTIAKMVPRVFIDHFTQADLRITFNADPAATSGVIRVTLFFTEQIPG